jgi:hypothetical protein
MTKLTGSRSCWNYADLERDIIKRMVEARKDAESDEVYFSVQVKDILHRFLNSIPDGDIISDGYYRGFKESTAPREYHDFNEKVLLRLGDIYDANVDVMSSSERAIIRLMQQGGSWAERVYQAIPEVVDELIRRATKQPE